MKKTRIFTIAAAALGAGVVLAACGGSGGGSAAADKFVGHWDIKTLEAGGESLDIQEIYSLIGQDASAAGMDLTQDGKMTLNMYGDEEATTGTWKSSGNNSILITVDGQGDQTASLEGDKLVMSYDEGGEAISMTFVKSEASASTTAATTTSAEETTAEEATAEETTAEETTAAQ